MVVNVSWQVPDEAKHEDRQKQVDTTKHPMEHETLQTRLLQSPATPRSDSPFRPGSTTPFPYDPPAVSSPRTTAFFESDNEPLIKTAVFNMKQQQDDIRQQEATTQHDAATAVQYNVLGEPVKTSKNGSESTDNVRNAANMSGCKSVEASQGVHIHAVAGHYDDDDDDNLASSTHPDLLQLLGVQDNATACHHTSKATTPVPTADEHSRVPVAADDRHTAAAAEEAAPMLQRNHEYSYSQAVDKVNVSDMKNITAAGGTGDKVAAKQQSGGLMDLLSDPEVLVFLWRTLLLGFGAGTIGAFVFLHVETLGGSETLMGLMLAVSTHLISVNAYPTLFRVTE